MLRLGMMIEWLSLPALGLAGWCVLGARRDRTKLRFHRAQADVHARALGLLAQDLGAAGLVLAGHADQLAPPQAAAVALEARQLSTLADGVAEHLAASAGPRRLLLSPVPLAPLLDESVAVTTAQLGPAARRWRIAPDFAALTLQVDRRAMRGALLPVLARAARCTRDGDWIDIRPVVTPESVAIVIEDEGAGLAAEDLGTAAGITEAARTRGLGFGLATARALLEAHGGALRLEAVRGVGARAWLTLPRHRLVVA